MSDCEIQKLIYGDLRKQLAEMGDPWSVDPTISDDEPLPLFPLGGRTDEEDAFVQERRLDPETDVREIIADLPPNDPHLAARWSEAGVPSAERRRPAPSDRDVTG